MKETETVLALRAIADMVNALATHTANIARARDYDLSDVERAELRTFTDELFDRCARAREAILRRKAPVHGG